MDRIPDRQRWVGGAWRATLVLALSKSSGTGCVVCGAIPTYLHVGSWRVILILVSVYDNCTI